MKLIIVWVLCSILDNGSTNLLEGRFGSRFIKGWSLECYNFIFQSLYSEIIVWVLCNILSILDYSSTNLVEGRFGSRCRSRFVEGWSFECHNLIFQSLYSAIIVWELCSILDYGSTSTNLLEGQFRCRCRSRFTKGWSFECYNLIFQSLYTVIIGLGVV